MTKRISSALLEHFAGFLAAKTGWYYPKEKHLDLLKGLRAITKEFGYNDPEECICWLLSKPLTKKQVDILACQFTVGETYFIREPKVFDALEKNIFVNLIRKRREMDKRLRIWSAGSCTGEEPYSIAILLTRMIHDIQDWNITILGTDINPLFLERAQTGIYREWSFRGTPFWLKENYFTKTDEGFYEILPQIKRMVKFQHLNLVEDAYPSLFNDTHAMDIVFCRNVLMYFTPEQMKNIVDRFFVSLIENGWLIVGSSETSRILFSQFVTVNFPGAILYEKDTHEKRKIRHIINSPLAPLDAFAAAFNMNPVYYYKPKTEPALQFHPDPEPVVAAEPFEPHETPATPSRQVVYENALSSFEAGEYEAVIEQVTPVVNDVNSDAKLITLLAKAYANQGRLNDAIQWCERAIEADKLNPESYRLRAVILQEQGQTESAVTSLKRALYLDSNFVLAHYMLGNISYQIGKINESRKYFQNAIELLKRHKREEVLPESDGITAGRLMEMIQMSAMMKEHNA
jgi:chemotaxis protein methyltransferase CheR